VGVRAVEKSSDLTASWSDIIQAQIADFGGLAIGAPHPYRSGLWFQGTGDHDTPRQRWHFDLLHAPEVADERIAAAVSPGGSVVDTSGAPSFTVLADPDGNRVCACSAMGR
jgi:hypothetical protein